MDDNGLRWELFKKIVAHIIVSPFYLAFVLFLVLLSPVGLVLWALDEVFE